MAGVSKNRDGKVIDPMQWDAMTEREKDAIVGGILELPSMYQLQGTHSVWTDYRDGPKACAEAGDWIYQPEPDKWDFVPSYTTDHTAVAEVRAEVARRDLIDMYIAHLCHILDIDAAYIGPSGGVFRISNATPDQQCHAFVRACGREV